MFCNADKMVFEGSLQIELSVCTDNDRRSFQLEVLLLYGFWRFSENILVLGRCEKIDCSRFGC